MKLKDKLEACGVRMDPEQFRPKIRTLFDRMYGDRYTDERMLCRPRIAESFCDRVRAEIGADDAPDWLILEELLNERKQRNREGA
jgi:hypothetical protein